jgi:hypothetical protein
MLPKEGEEVWRVTTFGSVYVTANPARAGSALVTIAVSNLDEHATALAARGLSLDEQGADSSALRQLTITDGDGDGDGHCDCDCSCDCNCNCNGVDGDAAVALGFFADNARTNSQPGRW